MTININPPEARTDLSGGELFDVSPNKREPRDMKLHGGYFLLALAAGWTGCEQAILLDDPVAEKNADLAEEELLPMEESDETQAPAAPISDEEGRAKLAALIERLEEASEQVVQAEGDLPLVFGAVTDSKGNRYVGQFMNGKRHGYGSYVFATGDRYEGEYQNGKRHGYGTYQFKKGDRYVGYFENGTYHNQGAYFFGNGDQYFGQYAHGKKNGKGTLSRANGERYEGEFKQGKRHGLGRCTFSNGDHYAGSWKNDEPEGWGSYHYTQKARDQKKTDGFPAPTSETAASMPENLPPEIRKTLAAGDDFLAEALQVASNPNQLPAGDPALIPSPPPSLTTGADEPLAPNLHELPGGDRYVGQLRDGQPHGQGAYIFSDGERYVGDFMHGLHHGQGLLVLGDGSRYLGEWKDGLRHGYGVLYGSKGKVEREGYWAQDEPVGK